MYQEIIIIEKENIFTKKLKSIFKNEKNYIFTRKNVEYFDNVLDTIPDLIIINELGIEDNTIKLCERIRNSKDLNATPIIVIGNTKNKTHKLEILKTEVEYFLNERTKRIELYYIIKNIIRLMTQNRKVSPLTGLPGNNQIQMELTKRLLKKETFQVLYIDLDHFKEYNDTYGFLKGDEVIKFTSKILLRTISKYETKNSFIGHIGGDDFVLIINTLEYVNICKEIINKFDEGIKKHFKNTDIKNGYIEVKNRKGDLEKFNLTTISIGVVKVTPNKYKTYLEIGEVGAEVKHEAKKIKGSSYIIDRRRSTKK